MLTRFTYLSHLVRNVSKCFVKSLACPFFIEFYKGYITFITMETKKLHLP